MDRISVLKSKKCELKKDTWGYHDYNEVSEMHKLKSELVDEVEKEIALLLSDEKVKKYIDLISEIKALNSIDSGYDLPK